MLFRFNAPALALALAASAGADAAPLTTADYLKESKFESLSLSPNGDYLAAKVPFEDRSGIVIIRRSDLAVTATVTSERDTHAESHWWVSPERLFMTFSTEFENDEQRYMLPELYAVDADGHNKGRTYAYVVDSLEQDDDRVLIAECNRSAIAEDGCVAEVLYADADDFRRRGKPLVAPIARASFLADHDGVVRFAWAVDKEDVQKVYYRAPKDKEWTLVHDEAVAGIEKYPIRFARDGKAVYVLSEAKKGPGMVQRYDLATRKYTTVLRHGRVDPSDYIFSADGRELVGAYFADGVPEPYFIDPDAPEAALAAALAQAFPDAYARVVQYSRDGNIALVEVSSDRDPGRWYAYERASKKLTFLVEKRPWIDPAAMARTKPYTVTTADGLTLSGLLTTPAKGTGPWPMVVNPHGGPHGRDAWTYDGEAQLLASRGYAVLKVDFRGSTGYGKAFMESGYGEWGRKMQDDVTAATRWAIEQKIADPSRICIYGGSYGAYAAMMGPLREPGLYRCAAGAYGVYDLELIKKWGDIRRSRWGKRYLDRTLGTDAGMLARHSPARRAKELELPLFVAHGGRDDRASPEHYRAMTAALDRAGVSYASYYKSYEAHGMYDDENYAGLADALLAFLAKHLKPATSGDAAAAPASAD